MRKLYLIIISIFLLLITSCSKPEIVEEIHKEPEFQTSQLQYISELATADVYYHSVAKYTEKDADKGWFNGLIFGIGKKDMRFWIEYTGIVKIGIDASKIYTEISDSTINLYVPKPRVISFEIDSNSLNENSYIIDSNSAKVKAEDQVKAFELAKNDLIEKVNSNEILLNQIRDKTIKLLSNYINNISTEVGKEYTINILDISEEPTTIESTSSPEPTSTTNN